MERVFVGNLPRDIRIKDIDDFFKPFGKLVSIDVNHRATPVFAYVQFDNALNAFNAVKARHGYDYEGYTLQLRLIENEVRNRRDTPPPPPPPMLGDIYNRRINNDGFANNNNAGNRMDGNFQNSSFQSNYNSTHWPNSNTNRPGIQQNMIQYPIQNRGMDDNNRSNIQQQSMVPYSSNTCSNMYQQQYSNINRSEMQQQNYSNFERSIRPEPIRQEKIINYPNTNRPDPIPQQNMINYPNTNRPGSISQQNVISYPNKNRPDSIPQQNINHPNSNRSNIPQLQSINMTGYSKSDSWNNNENKKGGAYNEINDPYARKDFEDSYTRGLSGSGRKWFNRYIRIGLSPEMARLKALEHRTVPYLRDDPISKKLAHNTRTSALETIGTTIMSLLSTNPNPVNNYSNGNWRDNNIRAAGFGGGNYETHRPSSSNVRSSTSSQAPPSNAVSRKQYLKSLDILKNMRVRGEQSAEDRITKKYHTQIVKDYEQYEKLSRKKTGSSHSITSQDKLYEMLRKKKKELLTSAKNLGAESRRQFGGAHKKRFKILMEAGFSADEAKLIAVHPIEKLKSIISLKNDYDLSKTNRVFKLEYQISNDYKYLNQYKGEEYKNLSLRIKLALRKCIMRIHDYETEKKISLTTNRFVKKILNDEKLVKYNYKIDAKKTGENASTSAVKKQVEKKVSNVNKKEVEKKVSNVNKKEVEKKTTGGVEENATSSIKIKTENAEAMEQGTQDQEENVDENPNNEDNNKEQEDDKKEEFEDVEIIEIDDDDDDEADQKDQNENVADENKEEDVKEIKKSRETVIGDAPEDLSYIRAKKFYNKYSSRKLMTIGHETKRVLRRCILKMRRYEQQNGMRVTHNKFTYLMLNKYREKGSTKPSLRNGRKTIYSYKLEK